MCVCVCVCGMVDVCVCVCGMVDVCVCGVCRYCLHAYTLLLYIELLSQTMHTHLGIDLFCQVVVL